MKWLTVFLLTIIYDWVWAKYTYAVAHKASLSASAYSAALFALGGLVIMEYTADPRMLIPACGGAFLGTLLATRH